MSDDCKFWDMDSTTNLSLSGKVINALRPIRPFHQDIAFLSFDSDLKKVDLNIIPTNETEIRTSSIPSSSDLHKFIMENTEHQQD